MNKQKPSYYAILPANVRYDNRLKPNEKIIFSEITALSNVKGYCYASNKYFAQLYDVDKLTISRWLSHLQKMGYIEITYIDDGGRNIRTMRAKTVEVNVNPPIDEIITPPLIKKSTRNIYNTTSKNNTRRSIDWCDI